MLILCENKTIILYVWRSGKSAEKTQNLLLRKLTNKLLRILNLTSTQSIVIVPNHEKNREGGYKDLYWEMTTKLRTRIAIGSFFRSVPGESCKKSTTTDDWSIK